MSRILTVMLSPLAACTLVLVLGAGNLMAASPVPDAPSASPKLSAEQENVRIADLIRQLGDTQYLVRQRAQEELARIGAAAFDALTAAENSDDIEVASRAKYLVQLIRIELVRDSDSPQVQSILQGYESLDDAPRLMKAKQLSMLPGDVGVEPLCRLVRFERSPVVSKACALVIFDMPQPVGDRWEARAKLIESALAGSERPGARWLRADLEFHTAPESALDKWERLVAEELAAEEGASGDSSRSVAIELQRHYVQMLLKKNDRDRATGVMRKMIASETGDLPSLIVTSDWLVARQAWVLVDELAERFKDKFDGDPALLYMSAVSRRAQGGAEEADAAAKRAFDLITDGADAHRQMAGYLKDWGARDWSEREYRHVLNSTPIDSLESLVARYELGEMLHDQEHELRAAELLQELVDKMKNDPGVLQKVQQVEIGMGPEGFRARMNYFYACHWGLQKDREKQLQYLDEGIAQDPTDADVLIGLYQTSRDDPVRRKRALKLIQEAAEQFRTHIAESPEIWNFYNQYAWLVGNTEGDYDLAIQYSHKSLEFRPDNAGLIDTLAHCYAAKGDFATAVMYQTRATELEPNTLQIGRALERFKAGLAKAPR